MVGVGNYLLLEAPMVRRCDDQLSTLTWKFRERNYALFSWEWPARWNAPVSSHKWLRRWAASSRFASGIDQNPVGICLRITASLLMVRKQTSCQLTMLLTPLLMPSLQMQTLLTSASDFWNRRRFCKDSPQREAILAIFDCERRCDRKRVITARRSQPTPKQAITAYTFTPKTNRRQPQIIAGRRRTEGCTKHGINTRDGWLVVHIWVIFLWQEHITTYQSFSEKLNMTIQPKMSYILTRSKPLLS